MRLDKQVKELRSPPKQCTHFAEVTHPTRVTINPTSAVIMRKKKTHQHILMLRNGGRFSVAADICPRAERHTERNWAQKKNEALITRPSVIVPHLKYPPGIIRASKESKDRAQTTLIQHSPNEALEQDG